MFVCSLLFFLRSKLQHERFVMLVENGVVNFALVRLVALNLSLDAKIIWSPQSLDALLQEEWVKAKEGVFRAQLGGRFPTDEEMELLYRLGADAILIDSCVKYGGTLLLGATLKAVTRRVDFMHKGASVPEPVYLLGSNRKLDPKLEMPEHVPAILEETGALFADVWKEDAAGLSWPASEIEMLGRVIKWNQVVWDVRPVSAPDGQKPDGSVRPANTAETVREWLKVAATPGHYLIVSSQPFCEGQKMAVERAVKEAGEEGYTFDVCGPAAPPLPLSRWLDNLAKQLWEEVQLLPKG